MQRRQNNRRHYKWHLFYYNPNDPSFFVEREVGIGQDINWAHRSARYVMLFIILFPLLAVLIPVLLIKYF